MRILNHLGRGTLGICAAVAMLAGCGGGSGTPLSPSPAGPSTTPAFAVLYSFGGETGDGVYPAEALINVNGTFYSTTRFGGSGSCSGSGFSGCGTVYAITMSGKETVLHSFAGGSSDGEDPEAGLLDVKGTLYGTTEEGGPNGAGTAFSITPSGTETVLHSFGSASGDGAYPAAGLMNVNGTLDGTTSEGGVFSCSGEGCGTEFSMTTSGNETVGFNFDYKDGAYPIAGLINVKGTLYGTTFMGGASGIGTVFSIAPSGKETVLHSFRGGPDGVYPMAGLTVLNGTLYGTTLYGGTGKCEGGCGTVFAITTSGKETVVHSFSGSGGGKYPQAGLISVSGTLYGTTTRGGAKRDGTVFSLSP